VIARGKDRTKTSEDRTVQLCPRALEVMKRQLALRERWQRLGVRIDREHLFFKHDGEPIRHLHYGWKRWRHSLERPACDHGRHTRRATPSSPGI
jgi:integrase